MGGIENVATATGSPVDENGDPIDDPANPGNPLPDVTDASDTGTDADGNPVTDPDLTETPNPLGENPNDPADPTDDPTTFAIAPVPGISLTKSVASYDDTNGNSLVDAGDTLTYSFLVSNTGNVDLSPVTITDTKLGLAAELCVTPATLLVGETDIVCTTAAPVTYVITGADVTMGGIENVATATGSPVDENGDPIDDPANPGNPLPDVTDASDTGTDADGNPVTDPDLTETPNPLGENPNDPADPTDDPTTFAIAPVPGISLTKSVASYDDTNGNSLVDAGDTLTYSFLVSNTGNVDLSPVTITDTKLGLAAELCVTPATLLVGETDIVCTTAAPVTYVITGADVTMGGIENVATATGSPVDENGDPIDDPANPGNPLPDVTDASDTGTDADGNPVTDPDLTETPNPLGENPNDPADPTDDPTTFAIAPVPGISLTKSVASYDDTNGNSLVDAGDTLTYSFLVSNTGNVDLSPVTITDTKLGLAAELCVTPATLLVGETDIVCTTAAPVTYVITGADVTMGGIENVATATGSPVDENGDPIDDPANPGNPLPDVTDASDTGTDADGNPVTDPDLTETPNPLGENPNDPADPTDDPTTFAIAPVPGISLTKSVASYDDTNGNSLVDAGDTLTYSFLVSNTGNVDLSPVTITDTKLGLAAELCVTPATLLVGETDIVCTTAAPVTYVITGADVTMGGIENVATATGSPVDENGDPIDDPANPGNPLPDVTDASDTGTDADGNPVTDPDLTETPNPLGENPNDPADPTDDPTTFAIAPVPGISLTKSVASYDDTNGNSLVDAGDTLTYSFLVSNTGNVDLSPVTITDTKLGLAAELCVTPATLLVGETDIVCTTAAPVTYVITGADVTMGGIENVATATGSPVDENGDPIDDPANPGNPLPDVTDASDTGTDADGNPVTDPDLTETPNPLGENPNDPADPTDDPTTFAIAPVPGISLTKSVASYDDTNGNSLVDAGDTLTYSFLVSNTGNVDLSPVTITDTKLGLAAELCVTPATLLVGETDIVCTTAAPVTYVITGADVTMGGIENVATATGSPVDENGDPIDDPANPGNPLPDVTDASDTGTDADGNPVTDPDLTETPNPLGENPNDPADPTDDPTTFAIAPVPGISLTKSVASYDDTNGNSLVDAGDTLTYSFLVSNTGNVDLSPVTITDTKLGLAAELCVTPATLLVGETDIVCTTAAPVTYVITGADVTMGGIENVATATGSPVDENGDPIDDPANPGNPLPDVTDASDTGTDADGNPVTDPDLTETPNPLGENPNDPADPTDDPTTFAIAPVPGISLTKSVASYDDTNGNSLVDAGDTLTYSFLVSNTGNVDLSPVTITDTKLGLAAELCVTPATLLVGETDIVCTTAAPVTYVITGADVTMGGIENVATATGSPVDENGDPIDDPANPGNPLPDVTDASDTGTDADGNPVTDPDLTETPNPLGENPNDPADPTDDPTTFAIAPVPGISLTKSVASYDDTNGNSLVDAGDTLTYSFLVSNTGNTSLAAVSVADANIAVVDVCTPAELATGGVATCTGSYLLTQADVDVGAVENTAEATGTPVDQNGDPVPSDPTNPDSPTLDPVTDTSDTGTEPDGTTIPDSGTMETPNPLEENPNNPDDPKDDPTTYLLSPVPALELIKSVVSVVDTTGGGQIGVGDTITYKFDVVNMGNVALSDVTISDATLGLSDVACVDLLGVGETAECSTGATYVITREDMEKGGVENTAEATGTPADSAGTPLVDLLTGESIPAVMDTSDTGTEPVDGTDTDSPVTIETIPDPKSVETPAGFDGVTDDDPTNDPTTVLLDTTITPISLGWFRSSEQPDGSTLFEWVTTTEVANLGFDLWTQDSTSGEWIKLNDKLIASQGDSLGAQSYEYQAAGTLGNQFRLTDVGVTGKQVHHGPFELGETFGVLSERKDTDWDTINRERERNHEERQRRRGEELKQRLQQFQNGQELGMKQNESMGPSDRGVYESSPNRSWWGGMLTALAGVLIAPADALEVANFSIPDTGIYRVTHEQLLGSNVDLAGQSVSQIGLKERGNQIPLKISPEGTATFGPGSVVEFAAEGLDTIYSGSNTVTLTLGEGQQLITPESESVPSGPAAYSYLSKKTYAPQSGHSMSSPDLEDAWFAELLSAKNEAVETEVSLYLDDYAPPRSSSGFGFLGSGPNDPRTEASVKPTLAVELWGRTSDLKVWPDHHVEIDLNGQPVMDLDFDGIVVHESEKVLSRILNGSNQIKIRLPRDRGVRDEVYLDSLELSYPRQFKAEEAGSGLVFSSSWNKFSVRDLESQAVTVFRLLPNGQMRELLARENMTCSGSPQSCSVTFGGGEATDTDSKYYVSTQQGIRTAAITIPPESVDVSATQVKHLIIAHPDFMTPELTVYANELTSIYGEEVAIVDVESIYATYSGHVLNAAAIERYIDDTYALSGTKRVTLIGGDVYDYRDYLKSGAKSFVPTRYVQIGANLNGVPSDAAYADIDGDNLPDIEISRLPVRTRAELSMLLQKRRDYLARDYKQTAVFAADYTENKNGYHNFQADTESLVSSHFNDWGVQTAYVGDLGPVPANQVLSDAIESGVSLTSYMGHSNTDRWTFTGLLGGEDVTDIANAGRPTIVTQWGCLSASYVDPEEDSMAHRFLVDESGNGAVVVMGATSYTHASAETAMADLLFARLQQGMRIGAAVKSAKRALGESRPNQLDILLGWTVLGPADLVVSD